MKKLAFAVLMTLVMGTASFAVPFWYGDEEVAEVVTKYFEAPEVTADQFLTFDLAIVEHRKHAKIMGHVLADLICPLYEQLYGQHDEIKKKEADVDRFFDILYCKEIHDELWEQTRPLKQDAYRKALGELKAMQAESLELAVKINKLEKIKAALKKIGSRFKEIEQ